MKILHRIFKTNQRGMLSLHAVLPILLAVIAVGGVGAYVLNSSHANTASVCGALYSSNTVVSKTNANWVAAKNDNSVRNMAYSMCKLKMMDVTAANAVNVSGTWTPALKAAIVKFQLSKAQLKGAPDGYPGPLTACMMGLTPSGFSNNSCASVTKPSIVAVADPAVPKPAVSLTTSAATVKTSSTVTLSWKSTGINVTCTSTIPTQPTPAVSGSYVYKMPDATAHTFTLTCKNPGGSTVASVKATGVATATTPAPAPAPAPAPTPTTPSVDTALYTTLPAQPLSTSSIYASWVAWKQAIATATAQKLTGQALITNLSPYRQKYLAAFTAEAIATAPNFTCSELAITDSAKGLYSVSIKNTGKQIIDVSLLGFGSKTPASSVLPSVAKGSIAVGGSLTVNFTSKNPIASTWSAAYKTASATTTALCVVHGVVPPVSGTVVTLPIPAVTAPKPGDTSGGGAPGKRAAPPKVADLGYTANLHCVTTTKDKTKVTGSPCATANAVMLTVYGTNKTPEKNKLSYDIDVTATADKFGRVNGCAPRTIVLSGVNHSYECTVLYTDQSFFVSVKNSVTNAFNSILRKAKADTSLDKSEAKAAVAKLQKVDALTKNTTIVFSYKGYESQTIKGTNLTFDYNETSAIERIKNIQEADCKAAGGNFVSFADGCDLPKNNPAGGNTGGTGSGGPDYKTCGDLYRVWSGSKTSGSCLKPCISDSYSPKTATPFDKCVPNKTSKLPNTAAKKACAADGGKYTGNIISGWKCVYPAPTQTPIVLKCADPAHYNLIYASNAKIDTPNNGALNGARTCEYNGNPGQVQATQWYKKPIPV